MTSKNIDNSDLTPEEHAHLEKIHKLLQDALADGKLSESQLAEIQSLINADQKVTPAELQTIRATVREALGDAALEPD